MKKRFLLLCLLAPLMSLAQIQFNQISGKWQEFKRAKEDKQATNFSDTMRVEIKDEFVLVRYNLGPTLIQHATLDGKTLQLEKETWQVIDFSPHTLVIQDKNWIHYFSKAIEFAPSPVTKKIPGREEGVVQLQSNMLLGKWTCYKKTDPAFEKEKFYIKFLHLKEDKGQGLFNGTLTSQSMDSVILQPMIMQVEDNELVLKVNKEEHRYHVIKSDGEELILEQDQVTYFLKQFGKK